MKIPTDHSPSQYWLIDCRQNVLRSRAFFHHRFPATCFSRRRQIDYHSLNIGPDLQRYQRLVCKICYKSYAMKCDMMYDMICDTIYDIWYGSMIETELRPTIFSELSTQREMSRDVTTFQVCTCARLTHWGRVTHICVSTLTIIGSDNGLSPDRRQTIVWTNAGLLLIGLWGTNFSEILIEILASSFKKMRFKVTSAKRRPFCLGLDVLKSSLLSWVSGVIDWTSD